MTYPGQNKNTAHFGVGMQLRPTYVVTIDHDIADDLDLRHGDIFKVQTSDGRLVLEKERQTVTSGGQNATGATV